MVGTSRTRTVVTALGGTALIVAYAVVAAVQILVWNPLAAIPGQDLAQIRSAAEAAGEHLAVMPVLIFLGIGPAIAAVVVVLAARGVFTDARTVAVFLLGVVAAGAPAYFMASFGPGMALADAFLISGGDHAAGSAVLYVASALAIAAMPVAALAGRSRPRAMPAQPS
ncbi:hypothetical protein [Microbacterium suaedae]|uniref:hypothetical protein n=1 Tax=Microbacterium suaedae TaxID=2067813 RepID=UPI000DA15889|nr:hypothetical protein [Microbacterium suaedae]